MDTTTHITIPAGNLTAGDVIIHDGDRHTVLYVETRIDGWLWIQTGRAALLAEPKDTMTVEVAA